MKKGSLLIALLWSISAAASAANVTIHYKSISNNYDGWGLHIWAGKEMVNGKIVPAKTDFRLRQGTSPNQPLMPDKFDNFGVVFTIPVKSDAKQFSYTVTNGKSHHMGITEWKWIKNKQGFNIWLVENDPKVYRSLPEQYDNVATVSPSRKVKSVAASPQLMLPVPQAMVNSAEVKTNKTTVAKNIVTTATAENASEKSDIQHSLTILKDNINKKNKTISKLQSALNSSQNINQRLQNNLNQKLLDYQKLLQLNDKISNENRILTASNQGLLRQTKTRENNSAEQQLIKRNQQLEQQLSELNKQLLGLQNDLNQNNSDAQLLQNLQQQLPQLQSERDELQQQNAKLSSHIVELIQNSDSPIPNQANESTWWLFAAIVATLIITITFIFLSMSKRYKEQQLKMEERLKLKEDEIKTEKIYAAAANEKLRKVLHAEAKQQTWAPLPDGLPHNLRKDTA
ncbi:pullulanase-associated domain-containing protein [Agarivorans sp. Z349TD_8]|uniref:pullulanase-associated domain-containing protein n=1 Tax=Agarivorans sp. Z349TD_8 TaxID=3421434 RepID=UPI003D7E291B